jgi:ribonuclease-3
MVKSKVVDREDHPYRLMQSKRYSEALKDPKTRLQEHLQARGMGLPQYQVIRESGKDHAKNFEVECSAGEFSTVIAEGTSRRKAEQAAASRMLDQIIDGH